MAEKTYETVRFVRDPSTVYMDGTNRKWIGLKPGTATCIAWICYRPELGGKWCLDGIKPTSDANLLLDIAAFLREKNGETK